MTRQREGRVWPFERSTECPLDPPPELRTLQREEPVSKVTMWDGSEAWLATRYDEVRTLLRDARLSADTSREGFPQSTEKLSVARGEQKAFIRMDPPRHTQHRNMIAKDFMVSRIIQMRPYLEGLADDLLDDMVASGPPVDLVSAVAQPLPARVTCGLLDLPDSDSAFFLDRVRKWLSLDVSPEVGRQATADVLEYFDEVIDVRARKPGSDMISKLITENMHAGTLTKEELKQMLHLLVVAGFDTTANMIALGVLTLVDQETELAALRDAPELWPNAVEELLRYLTVAHHQSFRLATDEIGVGDACIHAGDAVIAATMIANRDPSVFPEPDKLDIRRDARNHLAFGYGVHQCLGQHLARAELQVLYPKLFERFADLRIAVDMADLSFTNSMIYGVEELPVTWTSAA